MEKTKAPASTATPTTTAIATAVVFCDPWEMLLIEEYLAHSSASITWPEH